MLKLTRLILINFIVIVLISHIEARHSRSRYESDEDDIESVESDEDRYALADSYRNPYQSPAEDEEEGDDVDDPVQAEASGLNIETSAEEEAPAAAAEVNIAPQSAPAESAMPSVSAAIPDLINAAVSSTAVENARAARDSAAPADVFSEADSDAAVASMMAEAESSAVAAESSNAEPSAVNPEGVDNSLAEAENFDLSPFWSALFDNAAEGMAEAESAVDQNALGNSAPMMAAADSHFDIGDSTAMKRSPDAISDLNNQVEKRSPYENEIMQTLEGERDSRHSGKISAKKISFGEGIGAANNKVRRKFPLIFCELEKDTGIMCPGVKRGNYMDQFYYDPKDNRCLQFVYNGCGGNANRFSSLWECNQSCAKKNFVAGK